MRHIKVARSNVNDVVETLQRLTGEEESVYGDSGYLGAEKRADAIRRNC